MSETRCVVEMVDSKSYGEFFRHCVQEMSVFIKSLGKFRGSIATIEVKDTINKLDLIKIKMLFRD